MLVLDSGGGVSGELAQASGPSSSQGPEVPVTAIPSAPSRKRLLVPASLPSGPDSPKLLQECYEACRTWGAGKPHPHSPPLSRGRIIALW